ncbi:MAG: leucine-rich repeat domain-containing protein, partial [Clostridia bacterium]|nr:leucine-rich repeat domain-containing protein [Clostridia bacterium]
TPTTSLIIPATITHIKPYAFTGFEALVSLATPNTLREIGESAFEGCTGLQNITFGNGIETIDERAFYECTALEEVVLPDGLKTLEEYAFAYCSSLKKVTIPATLTYCGTGAFEENTALQGIYIFDIAAWCNIEFPSRTANPLYFGAGKLYLNGTVYSTLTLPESVTEIGDYAFAGCKSLRTAVIPSFVTKIGCGTFVDCPNIAYNAYDNAYYVGTEENPYLILVKVKRKDISSCTIHADTVYIGAYAFENCTAITNISVPANVIAVGEGAFYNIRTLSTISFGASVRYIGAWAYYYNAYDGGNLRSVYFRNSTGWIMRHVRTGEEIAATVNDTTYNNALYFKEYNAAHVFIRND